MIQWLKNLLKRKPKAPYAGHVPPKAVPPTPRAGFSNNSFPPTPRHPTARK